MSHYYTPSASWHDDTPATWHDDTPATWHDDTPATWQLEAIIRISESLAKMRLSEVATEDDVQVRATCHCPSTCH